MGVAEWVAMVLLFLHLVQLCRLADARLDAKDRGDRLLDKEHKLQDEQRLRIASDLAVSRLVTALLRYETPPEIARAIAGEE